MQKIGFQWKNYSQSDMEASQAMGQGYELAQDWHWLSTNVRDTQWCLNGFRMN